MESLRGKVAVVTGGSGGIGRAMAEQFAREGMRIVLADVDAGGLETAVAEMRAGGAAVCGIATDVSVAAEVDALRDQVLAAYGAVHVLCNNAGVAPVGATYDTDLATWRWVIGVNLWGVIHGCQSFLPLLLDQDEGHIVNTASLSGLAGPLGMGAYNTTKHAVVGLSVSLHNDLVNAGSRVAVSVLCPGPVRTGLLDDERLRSAEVRATQDPVARRKAREAVAASGIGPEEVAMEVVSAVKQRRFWAFTHGEMMQRSTQARLDWMTSGHQ